MPDDQQPQINQDMINTLLPVTGQDPNVQQAPAINFQNLSAILSGQQQPTQQPTQGTAATGFDAKTKSSLDSLQPDFADKAKLWIQAMRDAGYNPMLHFGYRSPDEQQQLYQKYLAGGNKAVAPPMSYHTYGRAFDWVNVGSNGDLQWNNDKAYEVGQALAAKFGLTGIHGDNDHIQDASYKSWRDLPRSEFGNVRPRVQNQQSNNVSNG